MVISCVVINFISDVKMTDFKLIRGIYESVINHALEERLSRLEENYAVTKNQLDSEESSFTLALHLTKLIANSLAGIKGDAPSDQYNPEVIMV